MNLINGIYFWLNIKHAIGEADLKEVANPGASGAVFYKTSNDRYILKTIRHQETEVLKSFLRYYTLVNNRDYYFIFIFLFYLYLVLLTLSIFFKIK